MPHKYKGTVKGLMSWANAELEHVGRIIAVEDPAIQYSYALSTVNGMLHLYDALKESIEDPTTTKLAKRDLERTKGGVERAIRHLIKDFGIDIATITAFNTKDVLQSLNEFGDGGKGNNDGAWTTAGLPMKPNASHHQGYNQVYSAGNNNGASGAAPIAAASRAAMVNTGVPGANGANGANVANGANAASRADVVNNVVPGANVANGASGANAASRAAVVNNGVPGANGASGANAASRAAVVNNGAPGANGASGANAASRAAMVNNGVPGANGASRAASNANALASVPAPSNAANASASAASANASASAAFANASASAVSAASESSQRIGYGGPTPPRSMTPPPPRTTPITNRHIGNRPPPTATGDNGVSGNVGGNVLIPGGPNTPPVDPAAAGIASAFEGPLPKNIAPNASKKRKSKKSRYSRNSKHSRSRFTRKF